MRILSILLSLAVFGDAFDCTKKFWPKIKPGQAKFNVPGDCSFFPGYPHPVGGVKVSVAYTAKWGAGNRALIPQVAPILSDALAKAISKYTGDLKDTVPQLVVIITDETDGTTHADTWFPIEKVPPCQIKTYQPWTAWIGIQDAWAEQALAHEMYHSVQQLAKGSSAANLASATEWITEGSANYFSNLVYPTANVEWPDALPNRGYIPSRPIYAQTGQHVYGASLYFQSLEKSRGASYLNQWVLSTSFQDTAAGERSRLSTLSGFTDDFWTFAQQFSLKSIIDTSGVTIPGLATVSVGKITISSGAALLKTTPFTIKTFQLSLSPGQTVKLSASTNDAQRVAYRLSSDNEWTDLPSTLNIDCDDSGTTTSVLLLFISTKNAASDTLRVSVTQTKKSCTTPSGGGEGFVLYPLQSAQGGGYCPTGTHSSSLAVWCCPDGSNLDEKPGIEVAICCPGPPPPGRKSSLVSRIPHYDRSFTSTITTVLICKRRDRLLQRHRSKQPQMRGPSVGSVVISLSVHCVLSEGILPYNLQILRQRQ